MSELAPLAVPDPATTHWVPVGPGPLPDFRYRGDWAAGSYVDGDIVIYGGIAYLCVLPTSSAPVAWGTAALSYGTSLPASPVDGQEAILVDSVTAPTYQWRFRYNAGHSADAFKWECVGGTSLVAFNVATAIVPAAGWNGYAPSITIPRAGLYDMSGSAEWYGNGAGAGVLAIAIDIQNGQRGGWMPNPGAYCSVGFTDQRYQYTQGQVVGMAYYSQNGPPLQVNRTWMSARPVRVS